MSYTTSLYPRRIPAGPVGATRPNLATDITAQIDLF
jgi:hypothetical protein